MRVYAERTRAHRSPDQGIDHTLTFRDLHAAIVEVRQVAGKYYALLTLKSVARWEPEAQFDTMEPFMGPWVVDADAVARAAREGGEDTVTPSP